MKTHRKCPGPIVETFYVISSESCVLPSKNTTSSVQPPQPLTPTLPICSIPNLKEVHKQSPDKLQSIGVLLDQSFASPHNKTRLTLAIIKSGIFLGLPSCYQPSRIILFQSLFSSFLRPWNGDCRRLFLA